MTPTPATASAETTAYQLVPLTELRSSPLNPRTHFDKAKLEELATSIRGVGIIEPLVVRPCDGHYEIVAGERRFRAAKLTTLSELPVLVRDLTDAQVLEIQVVENNQRENVNPLEEAQGYAALMAADPRYQDVSVLAAKIGRHPTYIYRRLKLLALVAPAKKALLDGSLPAAHAEQIARLQPADQKEALSAALDRSDPMTAQELGRWIAQELLLNLSSAPWKKDDATLVPQAGPCTTCPKRTGANPDLFGDIQGKDLCADRVCFYRKRDAFLGSRIKELSKPDAPVVRLHAGWGYSGNDVKRLKTANVLVREQDWKEAGRESCPHTQTGIIVESDRRGDTVGTVKRVCTEPKTCRIHRERFDSTRGLTVDRKQREADRKRLFEARVRHETGRRTLRAVLDKVKSLTRDDLRAIALRLFSRLFHPQPKELLQDVGWFEKPKRAAYSSDYRGAFAKRLEPLSDLDLTRMVLRLTLWSDVGAVPVYDVGRSRGETDSLEATARRYKVDVKKIAAAVRKELMPKKKAAARKTKGRTRAVKAAKKETAA